MPVSNVSGRMVGQWMHNRPDHFIQDRKAFDSVINKTLALAGLLSPVHQCSPPSLDSTENENRYTLVSWQRNQEWAARRRDHPQAQSARISRRRGRRPVDRSTRPRSGPRSDHHRAAAKPSRTTTVTLAAIGDALLDPVGFVRWWWSLRHWPPTPCADCCIELLPATPHDVPDWQLYQVHDHVWAAAGMTPSGGWLCVDCLELRLGRPLAPDDLDDLPLNDLVADKDVPKLAELKQAAGHGQRWST
jgi:hypothetical protein